MSTPRPKRVGAALFTPFVKGARGNRCDLRAVLVSPPTADSADTGSACPVNRIRSCSTPNPSDVPPVQQRLAPVTAARDEMQMAEPVDTLQPEECGTQSDRSNQVVNYRCGIIRRAPMSSETQGCATRHEELTQLGVISPMPNLSSARKASIIGGSVFLIVLCVFGGYFGPQVRSYLAIRGRLAQVPAFPRGWDSVPQPLTDSSSSKIDGMTLSNYGYTFEVPWNVIIRVQDPGDFIETAFKGGQTVRFVNPALLRMSLRRFQQILSVAPSQISPFSSHRKFATDLELLNAKGYLFEHNPVAPEIFSFETSAYRGFEIRYLSDDVNSAEIYLFSADDREIELTVSTARNTSARLSQSDINRIIQSFVAITRKPSS